LALRSRRLGARRIQSELRRVYGFLTSLATIHKVLERHAAKPLRRSRLLRKVPRRYSRPIPGDRVQMDVCKIAAGLYQYTAVDDCTRIRVLGLFKRRTAADSVRFLDQVVDEMPFPIQRVQTDRGREFFATAFQQKLLEYGIKFRPIKPRSPHLNGKVERSQKTDLEEFYAVVDLAAPDLEHQLGCWQHYYNWERPHGSLNGKSPMDRLCELLDETPTRDQLSFDPANERRRHPNYAIDLKLAKLKRSP
jgi:transposase InsO family protein